MHEPPAGPERPGDEDDHRMPRWVKTLAAAGLLVVVVALVVFALTAGEHGPGRHRPAGNADVETSQVRESQG